MVGHWPYNIQTNGNYATGSSYYHTRLYVNPGDIIKIKASSGYLVRYCFLKDVNAPVSGGAIELVTDTSVEQINAGETSVIIAPTGAVAIAIYLGASPYNYTPESVTIWTFKTTNSETTNINAVSANGYRPGSTTVGARASEKGMFFPVKKGNTYLINITNPSGTVYCAFLEGLPVADLVTADYSGKTVTTAIYRRTAENDGFYLLSSSNNLSISVVEIPPAIEEENEGKINEDLNVIAKAALSFDEIILSSLPLRNYMIDADRNNYGAVDTYKHILVPISGGDFIKIRKGTSPFVYAWLTSNSEPVANAIPAFVSGTVRYSSSEDEILLKAPDGANFLFVYLYNNASVFPEYVGIAVESEEPGPQPEPEHEDIVVRGDGGANSKLFLNEERPYYFAQGWGTNDVYGELDKMLSFVPDGRHFIHFTDIHLDYGANFGLRQKQSTVMRYVQERLRNCPVVFGGDFIGQQAVEETAKKEMTWFASEYFGLFGSKFIPVFGDHDTDRVNGGLENGLPNNFIVDTFFGQAYKYGAIMDTLGIEAIDDVTFSSDPTTDATKKAAWKEYMKMHYYVDDSANKIRFIVITQGAVFQDIPARYNVPGESLFFICNAMQSVPDDYDVVILAHEFQFEMRSETQTTSNAWDKRLFEALASFKKKGTFTLSRPYYTYDEEINVWAAIEAKYLNTNFNFEQKTGRVFAIQGDKHYDFVAYWNYSTLYTHFAVDYTPGQNDVLWITQDRAALTQNPGFQSSWASNIPEMLRAFRRAPASVDDDLIGTTNEVLFDVFTINDNGITITRFGDKPIAGKTGLYPNFDESESYSVGDIVIWYTMNGDQYVVTAFRFISNHAPGAFNINEVETYIVTEPYVRNYQL